MTRLEYERIGITQTVNLYRQTGYAKCTPGRMVTKLPTGTIWACQTLELPDKNNQQKISCIPIGTYLCEYTFSPSFKKFTYEVRAVPNRAGIRIHPANFVRQLLGCIAPGRKNIDLDGDGIIDVSDSANTLEEFEKLLDCRPFILKIQESIQASINQPNLLQ